MTKKIKKLIDREFFVKSGRKGGLANSKTKNHTHFVKIGEDGAKKRWANKKTSVVTEVVPKIGDGLEKAEIV